MRRSAVRRIDDAINIIGGGPMGSSIALHLCMKGAKNVRVIERDKFYKYASCMLSAGGVRQQFSLKENVQMSMYGAEFLANASKEAKLNSDIPDVQFHQHGYLFLASKEDVLKENNRVQLECGADWIKLHSPSELSNLFPWLNTEGLALGSYGHKNEGYFDPWGFVSYMKKKAIELGAVFIDGEVCDIIPSKDKPLVNEVVYKDKQNNEIKLTGAINVIAAGAWSNQVLKFVKNHNKNVYELPVKPRKRCIYNFHCTQSSSNSNSNSIIPPYTTPLVVDNTGVYFRPEGKGNKFICGVSPPEDNDPDFTGVQSELECVDDSLFNEVVWPAIAERVPAFEEIKLTGSWAGFYDYNTFDQNAIIGHHPDFQNVIVCTGFSGHGIQHSPAAGRAVAELILKGKYETVNIEKFNFNRLLTNSPVFETGIV